MIRYIFFWVSSVFIGIGVIFFTAREWRSLLEEAHSEVITIAQAEPPRASIVYDRHGRKIGQFGGNHYQPLAFARMPLEVWQPFVSAEDKDFWSHKGISLSSIFRAAWANLQQKRWAQGASTITQQLIRHQLLSREKKVSRKLKEMILAIALEKTYSKEEILELYLNRVFFGNGAYGIAAAAQLYFQKNIDQLSWAESSFLAGIIRAPSRYDPFDEEGWQLARQRQRYVLRRLVEDKVLSETEADAYYHATPRLAAATPLLGEFGYAMFAVRQEVERLVQGLDWHEGGFQIETGMDLSLLKTIQYLSKKLVQVQPLPRFDSQMAILAMDANSGDVLGLIGGKDFRQSQFNRAIQMKRPIGSMALPLIYAKALSQGFQLGDSLYSLGKNKQNAQDPTLFDGLANGMLMESTRLGVEIGLGNLRSFFHSLGWHTKREDFDLILGLKNLSPLELASAYAAFANGGFSVKARLVKRVKNRHGQTILQLAPQRQRVLPYETSFVMSKTLQKIQSYSPGTSQVSAAQVGGYAALGPARQNIWQVLFDDKMVLTTWAGSDSGRQALPATQFWDIRQSSRDFYRILVDEAKILDTMMLKEPEGIRYHWVETLTFRGQKVFLPFTASGRW